MQKVIFLPFFLMLGLQLNAINIQLSNTGSARLDGIFVETKDPEGHTIFCKKEKNVQYQFEPFQVGTNQSSVLPGGWILKDSNGEEYFAVNTRGNFNATPPAQGWDVARAGVGLNVNFEITFINQVQNAAFAIKLTNDSDVQTSVFPNPTSGELTIEAGTAIQRLSLVNMAGQMVLSTLQSNQLNLSQLPNGVYTLLIETSIGRSSKKIIKE